MITKDKQADIATTSSSLIPSDSQPVRHNFTAIWREALLPYLETRGMLVLMGLLAQFYILPLLKSNPVLPSVALNTHFPDALWLMWRRFDSGFYVDIAQHGYWAASTLRTASNWIFLPLYPILILPFGQLFGGSETAFNIASVLVSNGAAVVAVVYLYLLARREFGSQIASRSVIYLALFPTSFYLSAMYPESLFLACSIACIYYARQRRWWLAGICGGLASLARIQGLVLIVPIAWEYWQVLSDRYEPLPNMSTMTLLEQGVAWLHSRVYGLFLAAREVRNWFSLLAIALIPFGLVPFLIYSGIKTGDFLATIHNHHVGWGRYFEYPWQLLINALSHPEGPNPLDWNFWILNITVIFAFLAFTIWSFRRLPAIYSLYTLVMVLMPLATSSINSISRYYLVVFPAMILLALWSHAGKEGSKRHFLITGLFASLLAVFMIFFVLGFPIIA